jgi:hypothetical protein
MNSMFYRQPNYMHDMTMCRYGNIRPCYYPTSRAVNLPGRLAAIIQATPGRFASLPSRKGDSPSSAPTRPQP